MAAMPSPTPSAPSRAASKLVGFLAATGVLAFKVIKGAELVKLAVFGAALWSVALFRPLPFAIAIIYAILVHETGHLLAMKYRGLKTSGIWFIPFVGAVAVARQPFRSHGETYFVAIAGPVFGLLSLVPLVAAQLWLARTPTDAAAWLAYASTAAFINAFNLLPIGVLDGGRIVKSLAMSLSPRLGIVFVGGSLLLCAGIFARFGSRVFALLLLLSIFEFVRLRKRQALPPMSRKAVAGGLVLYLFLFVLFPTLGLIGAAASKYLLEHPFVAAAALADTTLSTLPDVGCAREGSIRSIASTEPTEITFSNHRSTMIVDLYWLNYQGRRSFLRNIAAGKEPGAEISCAEPVAHRQQTRRGVYRDLPRRAGARNRRDPPAGPGSGTGQRRTALSGPHRLIAPVFRASDAWALTCPSPVRPRAPAVRRRLRWLSSPPCDGRHQRSGQGARVL